MTVDITFSDVELFIARRGFNVIISGLNYINLHHKWCVLKGTEKVSFLGFPYVGCFGLGFVKGSGRLVGDRSSTISLECILPLSLTTSEMYR